MRRLSAALIALLACGLGTGAFAQRAVYMDGATALTNNGGIVAPATSKSGVCSYWYNSDLPITGGIVSMVPKSGGAANDNGLGLYINHRRIRILAGGGSGVRFELYRSSANAGGAFINDRRLGTVDLPYDGQWHQITVAWDNSGAGSAYWYLDGVFHLWDSAVSTYASSSFDTKYDNTAHWGVGKAYVPLPTFDSNGNIAFLQVSQHYTGLFAEIYCFIGDGIYQRTLTANGAGTSWEFISAGTVKPLEMGVVCTDIMGLTAGFPQLCLRGNRTAFYKNGVDIGSRIMTVEGTLYSATSDPFMAWP